MADTVIREVARNVWTFSRPFMLGIVFMGGRSTAIKLDFGGVWILASTELNNETKQKLDELGDVKYIVAGNNAHTMFIKQYKTAYPAAKVIGPEDIQTKPELKGIKLDIVFGTADPNPMCGFEGEVSTGSSTVSGGKLQSASSSAMRRDAAKVLAWDFDRFIPCHGDVIETGAKAAWRSAFTNYLS
ncbi:hypothetical protein K466DRAFT_598541 [Polyporus arcularius HHB13444]|uniref:Metallo-beta-lactamase domain-containing protein n=1 Tax=Polyporus arcularius HHB13444 TaxID=1314778 RepID=A0A5C3PGW7_9APHY|nr:hypothetical protein K466DRAFT_598541 [Polyporus arcularius HHB13444]